MRRFLLLCALLAAASASAQEYEEPLAPLNGVGRITVQGGWRLTTNSTFRDSFYSLPAHQGMERAPASPGGPFLAGSFGYSVSELIELGIDVFATAEQLRLTGAPTLTNITYGGLVGLRFQTLWDILTPEGVVPFVGLQTGPTLVYSLAEKAGRREVVTQTWVGSMGATFRFSSRWGLTAEYRLAFARGRSAFSNLPEYKNLASFNAGGNWFALGVTYMLAPEPSRPFSPI
ncbi:hypothetical protein JQX13_37800 [Archangium violaceum]|uniref:hypothetical protein n=1 Tax=Archangium violaceum TaxID=83451 RepID=UPI00193C76E6|nr:hypothetical protein [Archangium violaceum]QRK05852.1 hypothetical protein JQX13_37800 [Archangium violaceum]